MLFDFFFMYKCSINRGFIGRVWEVVIEFGMYIVRVWRTVRKRGIRELVLVGFVVWGILFFFSF